jgi:GxxExxY protein
MERMDAANNVAKSLPAPGHKTDTPQDELTYKIIGLAMEVHNALGPGFPEHVYHRALEVSLNAEGVSYEREVRVDVFFRDQVVGTFDLDLVIGSAVIVELKALAGLAVIHEQQAIAYLAASGLSVALLINFGTTRLQYKRIFPPLSVQVSPAYQARQGITR